VPVRFRHDGFTVATFVLLGHPNSALFIASCASAQRIAQARDVAEFLAAQLAPPSGGAEEYSDQDRDDAAALQDNWTKAA
jgi:hypothetical protein